MKHRNSVKSTITRNSKEICSDTNSKLTENLDLDKEKIKRQLEAAKNVEERVKLFSKWMDKY